MLSEDLEQKRNIISACLKAMYVRYRKKLPEYFEKEVDYAMKDFARIDMNEIQQAFAKAYSESEEKMPLVKSIVRLWKGSKQSDSSNQSCGLCYNGLISVEVKNNPGKHVCCRCPCPIGQSLDKRILTYDSRLAVIEKNNDREN